MSSKHNKLGYKDNVEGKEKRKCTWVEWVGGCEKRVEVEHGSEGLRRSSKRSCRKISFAILPQKKKRRNPKRDCIAVLFIK